MSSVPPSDSPSREDLAFAYLEQLPYTPYPFQEQAVLAWFDCDQGLLVSAPTGMGKTLIAEAGLYEALKTGKRAYYTTPLIALTEQKYEEIKQSAERWGFSASDVGLITGNRRENPDATILVVVAEILFNRILASDVFDSPNKENPDNSQETNGDASIPSVNKAKSYGFVATESPRFSFDDVAVVVMDEFHNFSDPERGIVWEFTIGLLPLSVRTLLISATVGNAYEFVSWLRNTAHRNLALVQSDERKVPLTFCWVGDKFLPEHLEEMHSGDEDQRYVPALVFCFNRDECWDIAEIIKGRNIIDSARQKTIAAELEPYDWTQGAGPKLRQLLLRGIGIHHAGILPKYRRIVENLFQKKLLSIAVCTETLAAGINLPARSVVLPSLMKGPFGDKKMIDSSSAHQIFGRAGRPQFDDRGYVFVLAHEDDVRIARFREKYDQIPDDTRDPKLREAKKKLKKKMPTRNPLDQYWSEPQFDKLRQAPPGKLTSRGPIPWRLLAHAIESNPDLKPIRTLVARRLMGVKRLSLMQKSLDAMLLTLWRGGFIRLEPNPADYGIAATSAAVAAEEKAAREQREADRKSQPFAAGLFDEALLSDFSVDEPYNPDKNSNDKTPSVGKSLPPATSSKPGVTNPGTTNFGSETTSETTSETESGPVLYKAEKAWPTDRLALLTHFRGVNPLYGAFLLEQLGIADRTERIQAFESLLEMPAVVARLVRVPKQDELPPGNLAQTRLDAQLLELGLATVDELVPKTEEERREEWEKNRRFGGYAEQPVFVLSFAEKLKRLFEYEYSGVLVKTEAVWAAGEILLEFKGDFNKFITSNRLQKQEGVVFRHLLRLILLLEEFRDMTPAETTTALWQEDLTELAQMLITCCRNVDPTSTEETLKTAQTRKSNPDAT